MRGRAAALALLVGLLLFAAPARAELPLGRGSDSERVRTARSLPG